MSLPRPLVALAPLLSIAAAHIVVQAWLIRGTVCPARDGARYVKYALRLEEEPWRQVIRTSVDHPGYPLLLRGVLSAARGLGIESPRARVAAAQVTSSVAGLLFALAAYAVARRIWGAAPAWAGALCLAVLPRPAWVFADVLSDSLHALLWMASAGLFLRGVESRGALRLVLAGCVGSLAYWVRVDALTLPAAAAVACLAATARRGQGWRPLRPAALFLAGFAAGVSIFVVVCGKLSPKPVSESFFLGLGPRLDQGRALLASVALQASSPAAALRWLRDLAQEVQLVHLVSASAAAILAVRSPRASRPGPAAMFPLAAAGCYAAVAAAVDWRHGYVTGRYFLPVLPFIIAFGFHGACELGRRLRGPAGARAAAAALIAASLACSLPSLLKGGLHDQAYGQMAAARWVAARIADGETVHDPYFFPTYLAGLRGRTTTSASPPPGSRTHYLIAEDGDLERLADIRKLIEEKRAARVAELPRREGGAGGGVGVYVVRG